MILRNLISIFLSFLLLSCSSSEKTDFNVQLDNDVAMYNEAMGYIKSKEYEESIEILNELELQHPYSELASRGQVMAGFAQYSLNKYDEAILTLSKFVELNPNHPLLPYALYLKGYSYFERMPDVTLDQKFSVKAHDVFSELENRYPNSPYAKKSKKHIKTLKNHLASKEMQIGKYYQKEGFLLAGIKRYKVILKDYRRTVHVPESIYRVIECYISLGLRNQSIYLYKILNYNFPKSIWKKEALDLLKVHKINRNLKKYKKKELDLEKLDSRAFDLI
ncbi:MAG: outer membrane protein assembly factor BamD [Rickettsiales bacterium]|nr:outer membrane protein assembly factor BamD [Rickettsiales bacterium]